MKKVKYIGNNIYLYLTNGKVYDVIDSDHPLLSFRPNILIKDDIGDRNWKHYNEDFIDVTMEYNRNKTINNILK